MYASITFRVDYGMPGSPQTFVIPLIDWECTDVPDVVQYNSISGVRESKIRFVQRNWVFKWDNLYIPEDEEYHNLRKIFDALCQNIPVFIYSVSTMNRYEFYHDNTPTRIHLDKSDWNTSSGRFFEELGKHGLKVFERNPVTH